MHGRVLIVRDSQECEATANASAGGSFGRHGSSFSCFGRFVNERRRKGSLSCGFAEAVSHPLVGGERLAAFVAGWFTVTLVAFVGGQGAAFGADRTVHAAPRVLGLEWTVLTLSMGTVRNFS